MEAGSPYQEVLTVSTVDATNGAETAGPGRSGEQAKETGTARVKRGMAEMLKGGVIMDVVTALITARGGAAR